METLESKVLFFVFFFITWAMVPALMRLGLLSLPKADKIGPKSCVKMSVFSPLFAALINFVCLPAIFAYCDTHIVGHFSLAPIPRFTVDYLTALTLTLLLLLAFTRVHDVHIQDTIWGAKNNGSRAIFKILLIGAGFALIAYPPVIVIKLLIRAALDLFGPFQRGEQSALSLLKNLSEMPWLYWTFGVAAITLIPCVEELVFRGFFQNWLVDK
ncbi:MAG TPA: hypothetical protein VN457_04895, partial [Chlamydiales bacterium]|nr:hypothetical protein [Chlamydiales bacterium]